MVSEFLTIKKNKESKYWGYIHIFNRKENIWYAWQFTSLTFDPLFGVILLTHCKTLYKSWVKLLKSVVKKTVFNGIFHTFLNAIYFGTCTYTFSLFFKFKFCYQEDLRDVWIFKKASLVSHLDLLTLIASNIDTQNDHFLNTHYPVYMFCVFSKSPWN